MTRKIIQAFALALPLLLPCLSVTAAQGSWVIGTADGIIKPQRLAVPRFIAQDPDEVELASQITKAVIDDLANTVLFRKIPGEEHIPTVTSFSSSVQISSWQAIQAQLLINGLVEVADNGKVVVKFWVFDIHAERLLGQVMQSSASRENWRRLAQRVADEVFIRIVGEGGIFNSQLTSVDEPKRKSLRLKPVSPSPSVPQSEQEQAPEQTSVDRSTSVEQAVEGALAEGGQDTVPAPVSAPGLSSGEIDALRAAVRRCWNVGVTSTEALGVVVTVGISMTRDGKPESLRLLGFSGGSEAAASIAYAAARRAILRCGIEGYDLPVDRYEQWRQIEITFYPERMRPK